MCNFEEKKSKMKFENCNSFKRSFTNQGIGFTFNNEKENSLMKNNFHNGIFFPNTDRNPSLMKSASRSKALHVVIENSQEEVQTYENTIDYKNNPKEKGDLNLKPRDLTVSLHNPKEPADMRSRSFQIPLGQTTTFLITPNAREIDKSGKELAEYERNCRLDEETKALDIFNVYTRSGCLLECKMNKAVKECGCQPWNYPANMKDNVCRYYTYLSRF